MHRIGTVEEGNNQRDKPDGCRVHDGRQGHRDRDMRVKADADGVNDDRETQGETTTT